MYGKCNKELMHWTTLICGEHKWSIHRIKQSNQRIQEERGAREQALQEGMEVVKREK